MDTKLIESALTTAIKAGVLRDRSFVGSASDFDTVRGRGDAPWEPRVFELLLAALESDPDVRSLNSTYAMLPQAGRTPLDVRSIAKTLLTRAVLTGDVAETVSSFRSCIEGKPFPALVVMAVSGVSVTDEVHLGPHIMLMPLTSLPPSFQRGQALSADPDGLFGLSALVSRTDYKPFFYRPNEGGAPNSGMQDRVRAEIDALDEARCLLSLLGNRAIAFRSWVQPSDPLMTIACGLGAGLHDDRFFEARARPIDVVAVQELGAQYFSIAASQRRKTLRVPLQRLDRAGTRNLTDTSIDLGIALEALLLHDNQPDRGELTYRLSTRGAWLVGSDERERAEIRDQLRKVYRLRSIAVHSGVVEENAENKRTIERGLELCRRLICKVIDAKGSVDWEVLVMGGGLLPPQSGADPT